MESRFITFCYIFQFCEQCTRLRKKAKCLFRLLRKHILNVHLDRAENLKLFYYLAYFCYYSRSTVLFGTIHGLHCTISTYFYFYLQYFQQ